MGMQLGNPPLSLDTLSSSTFGTIVNEGRTAPFDVAKKIESGTLEHLLSCPCVKFALDSCTNDISYLHNAKPFRLL